MPDNWRIGVSWRCPAATARPRFVGLDGLNIRRGELRFVMTLAAMSAEVPVVYVFTPVTVDTAPGAFAKAVEGFVVTCLAIEIVVRIPEREIRGVVVEAPDQPAIRIVALRAVAAEAALVDVFVAMAVNALRPRFGENR